MVDTIGDDDAYRMGKVVDAYEGKHPTEQEEIEEALEDRMDGWTQTQIEGFAKAISDRRDSTSGVGDDERETIENRTTLSGAGVTGERTTMQKDANGKFLGKAEDIKTYEDVHGNIMGHNSNTGRRSKLVDSSER